MKKIKLILSFIAIFAVVLTIVGCQTSAQAEDTYVTMDINPSVELIVSPREKVIYANPLNEDAEILLVELDLVGMDLDDAIDLIIQTAIDLGYISVDEAAETFVSIESINPNAEIQERINNKVKEHVNNAFENRGMFGKAKAKEYTPEFIEEAEGYGVTPGFLFLAKEAVELNDGLLLEDALEMTEEELIELVKSEREKAKDVAFELRDEFHNGRDEIFAIYHPQIQDLEGQIETLETEIADLEAQIEAAEEGTDVSDLEAQIETLETDLVDLEAQLETVKTEFHEAFAALRDEFHTQSEALREEFKQARQQRRQEHQDEVDHFREEMKERRDQMRDQIRDYQDEEETDDNQTNGNNPTT